MNTFFLTFPTDDVWEEVRGQIPESATVDVLGVVYETVDGILRPIPGWHVNILDIRLLPETLAQYQVFPETPWRVFGNRTDTDSAIKEVTMGQCRLALFDLKNIRTDEDFYGLVNILPEDDRERAVLELKTRQSVKKGHPLVAAFAEINGWDLDELFEYASRL